MISFRLDGRSVYANVFEQRHSPAIYHVHFIDHITPTDIILHEEDGKIIPKETYGLNSKTIDLVVEAILDNPNRI